MGFLNLFNKWIYEFVLHLKRLNIKNGKQKKKIWEISKLNGSKRSYLSSSNFFYKYNLINSQKEWIKQNQLDDCKVKIIENQDEFDILTKDSVWNIEKRALKRNNNKRNIPTWAYPFL